MSRDLSTPVASRDWMRRRGREVVLLNARAGVTHDGKWNMRVEMRPSPRERRV
jgi:hypothetical protein